MKTYPQFYTPPTPLNDLNLLKVVLGDNLRAVRAERRLTQFAAAEILNMGYRHYQRIESGKTDVKLSTLAKLLDFCGARIVFEIQD